MKQPPKIPVTDLIIIRLVISYTNRLQNTGIAPNTKSEIIVRLGPNFSHNGPSIKRSNIVTEILAILLISISDLDKFKSVFT